MVWLVDIGTPPENLSSVYIQLRFDFTILHEPEDRNSQWSSKVAPMLQKRLLFVSSSLSPELWKKTWFSRKPSFSLGYLLDWRSQRKLSESGTLSDTIVKSETLKICVRGASYLAGISHLPSLTRKSKPRGVLIRRLAGLSQRGAAVRA